jgi:hypothetical protein
MQKKFGWRPDESSAHDALGVNAKSITVECHERERPTQHPPVQFLILVIQSLRFWRGRLPSTRLPPRRVTSILRAREIDPCV